MSSDLRDVQLPASLCEAVEKKFSARFSGLEPFLVFVMNELVQDHSKQMDESERKMVEQRLKDLGYM